MIEHLADFVGRGARIAGAGARILTPTGNAVQVAGAFVIDSALDRVGATCHFAKFVQDEAVLTNANWSVPAHLAAFALIAGDALKVTRILTGSQIGVACLVGRALRVSGANGHDGRCDRWSDGARDRISGRRDDGNRALSRCAASRVRLAFKRRPADVALRT